MQLLLTYDIDSEISLVRAVSIGAFAAVVAGVFTTQIVQL